MRTARSEVELESTHACWWLMCIPADRSSQIAKPLYVDYKGSLLKTKPDLPQDPISLCDL